MEGETDDEMNRVFFKTISRCLFDSCKALMDEYASLGSRRTAVVVAFEMFLSRTRSQFPSSKQLWRQAASHPGTNTSALKVVAWRSVVLHGKHLGKQSVTAITCSLSLNAKNMQKDKLWRRRTRSFYYKVTSCETTASMCVHACTS